MPAQKPTSQNWQFANWDKCRQHLALHALTPEESHGWHVVWNEQLDFLAPTSEGLSTCYELRKQLESAVGMEQLSQSLADMVRRYVDALKQAADDGQALGWVVTRSGRTIGLGINGIFFVTARDKHASGGTCTVIITGFLPGFGCAEAVRSSQKQPADFQARDVGRSRMRRDDETCHYSTRSFVNRMQQAELKGWSAEQKVYYLVFRPVVQFIRGSQFWKDRDQLHCSELKTLLPRMSQLKFDHWNDMWMKARCSHE